MRDCCDSSNRDLCACDIDLPVFFWKSRKFWEGMSVDKIRHGIEGVGGKKERVEKVGKNEET